MNANRKYETHTDLALEERERFEKDVEIDGVVLEKTYNNKMKMTTTLVSIKNEKGAKVMGKPKGNYITIETKYMKQSDTNRHREIVEELERNLAALIESNFKQKKFFNQKKEDKISNTKINDLRGRILVVGLGNMQATPDALGPKTISRIDICDNIYCISPGVFSQTGMETLKIVKGIVNEVKPDLVIAIDSLAARNTCRVSTTIQLADTGIIPGSGIGNNREGLNRENLGTTVIAIGVPMVVNSVTIAKDTVDKLLVVLEENLKNNSFNNIFKDFSDEEKYQLFTEIMSEDMEQMYVTPKDVDEIVDNLSLIIANSINRLEAYLI